MHVPKLLPCGENWRKYLNKPSCILTPAMTLDLEEALPYEQQGYNWQLEYSSRLHGLNFDKFYHFQTNCGPNFLVIRTTRRQIMGAFASEEWRHSGGNYYGNGESFLFRFQPKFEAFRWSRKNIYCMVGMDGFVGMGGDGAFGLQLNENFTGSCGHCETFGDCPLADPPEFECVDVEVSLRDPWAVRDPPLGSFLLVCLFVCLPFFFVEFLLPRLVFSPASCCRLPDRPFLSFSFSLIDSLRFGVLQIGPNPAAGSSRSTKTPFFSQQLQLLVGLPTYLLVHLGKSKG